MNSKLLVCHYGGNNTNNSAKKGLRQADGIWFETEEEPHFRQQTVNLFSCVRTEKVTSLSSHQFQFYTSVGRGLFKFFKYFADVFRF